MTTTALKHSTPSQAESRQARHSRAEGSRAQPGQAEPFWSGTVSGQGHSVYDVERAMQEYETGVSYPEISANVQRAALDAAMAEAFDAFFQEVDLTDLPMPGPTPPAQTDDFSPMP